MNKPTNKSPKPKLSYLRDDAWIISHFEFLIDHYPGQYVVVADGEPFIGSDVADLERRAQEKHPRVVTTGMPIPKPEDFSSILHVYP